MVNVIISRIPQTVTFVKFVHFLKKAILRCKKEFYVNYYNPEVDGYKQMSFSTTLKKAQKVQKTLDGFVYIHAYKQYALACWLENLDEEVIEVKPPEHNTPIVPVYSKKKGKGNINQNAQYNPPQNHQGDIREDREEYYEPAPKNARYSGSLVDTKSKSRSGGADHSSDLNALELQTELVRQQRILLEEETKLLLEKKKLEYLQQLGPNDYEKFKKVEEVYRRDDPREISEFLKSGQSTGQPEPVPASVKVGKKKLPAFVWPCKAVIAQMRKLIISHKEIDSSNRSLFYDLLTTTLKKRLTIAMEGKPKIKNKSVVGVYRKIHPFHTDIQLVDELVNTIKTSCWPLNTPTNETSAVAVNCDEGPSTGGQNQADDNEIDLTADDAEQGYCFDDDHLVDLDEFEDMEDAVQDCDEAADGTGTENEKPTTAEDADTKSTEATAAEEVIEPITTKPTKEDDVTETADGVTDTKPIEVLISN
ncbi:uncharacterized protein LOC112046091 [Bicyclus anynana]|uniref:Uncharacterized protein LOC112046091 n=1 Tax=Bicyclus anynana TaxID=110368 RepID=A0A6J1MZV5_BICAN|nr:uncharacterized protein LOC112046091 [Bicyclus anynana]XP_023938354.2 uncharacterized protein LOC112046091 [Bicyclus anynana]XP_052742753.1 uncharacterized protein LOC112046091 [Bicyclus anynana]